MKTPRRLLCPCTFLVPVEYGKRDADNNRRPVEPEVVLEIKTALDRQFSGCSIFGSSDGLWQGEPDMCLVMRVAVPENRVEELREVVYAIGKKLQQKSMYFEVGNPSVDLIDIHEDNECEGDSNVH